MTETILQTKLYIPPRRSNLVSRPQLIKQLDQGLQQGNKLALVSAPAGFGKTTLIVDWVHRSQTVSGAPRFAWLSLEAGDNNVMRFLTYLVAALQTIESSLGHGLLAALRSPESVNVEHVLTALLNELGDFPADIVLILDDYHVIESLPIDKTVTFLLDHLPPRTQLVIAGRIDPSLPLSRLRARGQLAEIRARDLRFTPEEAAVFLNKVMELDLSAGDIAALEKHTEGWIAGLQLAALSMQGLEQSSDIADFVNRFTGSDRYIQDYLADEVLRQRPRGTTEFLLRTSILSRLSAPLCDAVMGQKGSQAILESLDAANLFIIPLDNERRWYRYHHLFADLLAHRLNQAYPEQLPDLHRRASAWYESVGTVDAAVTHAQAAADNQRVADIIESHWQEIVHRGEAALLKSWLDALGPRYTKKSAPLSMAYCWTYVLTGANDRLPIHLKAVKEALKESAGTAGPKQPIRLAVIPSLVETIEATISLENNQPGRAKEQAQKAISLIPGDANPAARQLLQGAAAYRLAEAHRDLGEYDQACAILLEGLEMLKASENRFGAAAALLRIVAMYQQSGKTEKAVELCADTLAFFEEQQWQRTAPGGLVHVILADLQADSGNDAQAGTNMQLGRELAEQMESQELRMLVKRIDEKLANSKPPTQPLVEPLSPRELEVLQLIAQGLSNREISERLFLALDTVKGHNRRIFEKLGVKNRTRAVNKAISLKIIPLQ